MVNGAEGIGTGWSTQIPCFSPYDIVANIRRRLAGEDFVPMDPFYRGFRGEIIKNDRKYILKGKFETKIDEDILEITELPVGVWTRNYKSFIETLMTENPIVEDFREYHTTQNVHFEIKMKEGILLKMINNNEIEKKFKLSTSLSTGNYVLFDSESRLRRYDSEIEILEEFFNLRLRFYEKRKEYLMSAFVRDIAIMENKERFIMAVIEDHVKIRNVRKKEVVKQLLAMKFKMMKEMPKIKSFLEENRILAVEPNNAPNEEEGQEAEAEAEVETKIKEYNYLLTMPIWNLSYEQVEKLKQEVRQKKEELEKLKGYDLNDMWLDDLTAFIDKLEALERAEEQARLKEDEKLKRSVKNPNKKKPMKPAKKKPQTTVEPNSKLDDFIEKESKAVAEEKKPKAVVKPKLPKQGGGGGGAGQTSKGVSSKVAENKAHASSTKNLSNGFDFESLKSKDPNSLTLMERMALIKYRNQEMNQEAKPEKIPETNKTVKQVEGSALQKKKKLILSDDSI